jgi:hypothetical protein
MTWLFPALSQPWRAFDLMLDDIAFAETDGKAEGWIGDAPDMVLVGRIDLAAFGRIEFDAFTLLTDNLVLDLLEVPPVPDAGRAVPPADVELDEAVRVARNGDLVKVVDPIFRAEPLVFLVKPFAGIGFREVPHSHRGCDQFWRFVADGVCALERLPLVTHDVLLKQKRPAWGRAGEAVA